MRLAFAVVLAALAVPALALPSPAAAQDYPKLRPGLWELTHTSDNAPKRPTTATVCLDDTVQKEMFAMGNGAMQGMCSKHDFRMSGGRATGDFVCDMGGSTMHSKSTMVMNGDSGYRTEIHTTYSPPLMGLSKINTVLTARRLGACKPGQRPGDMTTPDGRTFNIRNAMNGSGSK
jgi:hypothetical protein